MKTLDMPIGSRLQEIVNATRSPWQIALSLFALSASAWLAVSPRQETLGIVAAIIGAVFLWRFPSLGMLAAFGLMLLLPSGIGTGTYTVIPVGVALWAVLVLVWLARSLLTRKWLLPGPSVTLAIVFFAASAVVSFLAGNLPWSFFAERASAASQIGGLFIFLISASMLFLIPAQLRDLASLKWGIILFATLAVPFALSRGLPFVGSILANFGLNAPQSTLGSQFWIWWLVIATGQSLFNQDLSLAKRILLVVVGLLPLLASIVNFRDWASGWLPPLISLLSLIALRWPRLAAGLVVIGLLLSTSILAGLASALVNEDIYSAVTRTAAARILLENVIPLSPVLGLGPSNYYFYTPLYPILGYAVRFNSHNNYLDLLAQTGIVGLAAFAGLILVLAATGMRLRNQVRGFGSGYVNACLAGLAGMLVSGMLGDWVIPFVYNIGIDGLRSSLLGWIFLGGMVALSRIQLTHDDEPSKSVEHGLPILQNSGR